ncbi:RNA polymerase sigma factor [Pseudoxanthobacter sp. M-2]|uniref:RNA polymerase sigma factor n=1 Tax=Pseudoxanthobacter sp. M-2 TaxID=3078754 RepID=UPI0038FBEDBB
MPETGTHDEAALIALALEGNQAAIRAIVRRHNSRLHRVARSVVRDQAEAEDVVQEAYLRAFSHLASFRGASSLSTWLTRITLNEAMGRVRRRSSAMVAVREDLDVVRDEDAVALLPFGRPPPTPEAMLEERQLRDLLDKAVHDLPEPFRCVFVLRNVDDLSIDDIARRLSLKPQTVKTRLHRARRLLKDALSSGGVTLRRLLTPRLATPRRLPALAA